MTPFVRPRPVEEPELRLVVVHHAGGSAGMYFPLARYLPENWDLLLLDLPGRGKRHRVPPVSEMSALVAVAVEDVRGWTNAPIALFGHSLGAVVAAEVARCLQREGRAPSWLGVSGRPAPGQRVAPAHGLHELSDDELMRRLVEMGGIPDRIDELPGFRQRLLKLVRSDLCALDSHRPEPGRERLTAALTVFGGTDDPLAPVPAMLEWAGETSGDFRQRWFGGGHFYFLGAAFPHFTRALVNEIDSSVRRAPLVR